MRDRGREGGSREMAITRLRGRQAFCPEKEHAGAKREPSVTMINFILLSAWSSLAKLAA